MVLTFGLFLHHVESHTVVAPNNVRGKDLGAAWLCLLLPCRDRNSIVTHITRRSLTTHVDSTFTAMWNTFTFCIYIFFFRGVPV